KSRQMAEADAEKYGIEARATADAEKVRLDGQARADSQRAQGESEADIIRLKGLAEAEAKRKIAEAFEQYGQAAMLDMVIEMIPEYAKQIASPLGNIDKITVVDTGGGEGGGANKVTSYATDLMSTLQETLKATSGIDVKEMLESYAGKHNLRPSIDQLTDAVQNNDTVEAEVATTEK
ncbi:flotillin family protein, partial [Microvirga sp. 3-52]|nr:flotillin family protein [Microvirga sp. 3-52]